MVRTIHRRRGQVTLETAVLIGGVVAAVVLVGAYFQRAAQGGIKSNADSLGTQFQATAPWQSHSKSINETTEAGSKSTQKSGSCQGVGGGDNKDCIPDDPALP